MSLREVLRPIGHPVMQAARGVKDIFRVRQAKKKWSIGIRIKHRIIRYHVLDLLNMVNSMFIIFIFS